MPVKGVVLSFRQARHFENCSLRTIYRRIETGEYVTAKTGRKVHNARTGREENEMGIPCWCLSPLGQTELIYARPEMGAFLELTR